MNQYFVRNGLWIKCMIGGLMIAMVPLLLMTIDAALLTQIPKWLPPVGLSLACFGTGIGAIFTDTKSAKIVRFVGSAAGLAVILALVF